MTACAGSLPPTHYYTLAAPAPLSGTAQAAGGLAIGVDSFSVDPPYDQDRIVYRDHEGSTEVGFYAYHRWAAPLGRLAAQAIADGLRGTRGVGAIEPATASGRYDARLLGRILYAEELGGADAGEVRLGVTLELVGRDGGVMWSGRFVGSSEMNAVGREPLVSSFNAAFADVVTRARAGLASALR